jgi:ribosomal protein S18 acetylase RimI-like enzyme
MTHDLHQVAEPDPVDVAIHPLTPAQVARHARRLGEINAAAYPPGHPDHHNDTLDAALAEMGAISRGEALGPMLPASRVATHAGAIVGAVFIVDRPGSAPEGGPWVLDVFRDPGSPLRGVGRALLLAALHSAKRSALPSMTLVVSHGNEGARRLYASVGFVDRDESWTLALPAQ